MDKPSSLLFALGHKHVGDRPERMPLRSHAHHQAIIPQSMMRRFRQHRGIEWMDRPRIVEHVDALTPPLTIIRASDDLLEHERLYRIGIVVVGSSESRQHSTLRAEASKDSHAIEFRDRSAIAEQYGADILGVGQIKESGWNFLIAPSVCRDLLR